MDSLLLILCVIPFFSQNSVKAFDVYWLPWSLCKIISLLIDFWLFKAFCRVRMARSLAGLKYHTQIKPKTQENDCGLQNIFWSKFYAVFGFAFIIPKNSNNHTGNYGNHRASPITGNFFPRNHDGIAIIKHINKPIRFFDINFLNESIARSNPFKIF